jgi:hypothetical protein
MADADQRRLYRLNIAKWDMEKAVELLEAAARHRPPSIEFEALVTSGIIHYARPFSSNEKDKEAPADARVSPEVIDRLSPDELTLHARLLDRRNKAIAHAEWKEFPVGIQLETKVLSSRRYSVYPEFLDVRPVLALATKVRDRLHNMVADHVFKLR